MIFTLQFKSPAKGGTSTYIVEGEIDKIGIILVLEHTNHADAPVLLAGNPLPNTLSYIPFADPPSAFALSIDNKVDDINLGYVHPTPGTLIIT